MSEEKALVIHEAKEVAVHSLDGSRTPEESVARAADEASAIMACVEDRKMYTKIQGGKHLKIEAWQMLAAYKGCLPREVETVELEDGSFLSKAQLIRLSDGAVLAEASMTCGDKTDGPWGNRPKYAKRSMAITRACGKVCRMTFGYIAHMAGYKTTPAEEMPVVPMSKRASGGFKPATEAQLKMLRSLAQEVGLPEDKRDKIEEALQTGLSQSQAGNLIRKANEAVQGSVQCPE